MAAGHEHAMRGRNEVTACANVERSETLGE